MGCALGVDVLSLMSAALSPGVTPGLVSSSGAFCPDVLLHSGPARWSRPTMDGHL